MKKLLILSVGILAFCAQTRLQAQIVVDTTNPIQFGIYTHYSSNTISGGFNNLAGFNKPFALFGQGIGEGISFGGEINAPLSSLMKATELTASIHIGSRFGFYALRGILPATEQRTIIVQGTPQQLSIEHKLDVHFASFGIEPMFEFTPPTLDNLRFHVGSRIAWRYSYNFIQSDVIQEPASTTYIEGGNTRLKIEAAIPNINKTDVGALFGVSYNFQLSKRFAVVPEIFYQHQLNSFTSDLNWGSNAVRAGVSVRVTLPTTKPVVKDTIRQQDTTTRAVPDLTESSVELVDRTQTLQRKETDELAFETVIIRERYIRSVPKAKQIDNARLTLRVFKLESDSTMKNLDTLVCNEIIMNDFHPILNYVFFENNSAILPAKYIHLRESDTKDFKLRNDNTQMETYYNVLNVLAHGLVTDPSVSLTITGCTSGEEAKQANAQELAKSRAESVAQYFISTWKIDPARLSIVSRKLPSKPSGERSWEGVEENQRVEITSNNAKVLEPIMLRDTILESKTAVMRVQGTVFSQLPVASWKVSGEQDRRVLFTKTGTGELPDFVDVPLDYEVMRRLDREGVAMNMNVIASITPIGKDAVQQTVTIPIQIVRESKLAQNAGASEVDRYVLMLFDFNKDALTTQNENLVHFIKSRLKDVHAVSVVGTTDRSGSEVYNQKLSERRAKSVAQVLNFPGAQVVGAGEDSVSYNNDLPEGRFHARTVKIEVERFRKFGFLPMYNHREYALPIFQNEQRFALLREE